MKKLYSTLLLTTTLFSTTALQAQEQAEKIDRKFVTYSVFYNQVNQKFNFPLIGFVNLAKKDHKGLQLGFINTTLNKQQGAQIGFINTTVQNTDGAQVGFINNSLESVDGAQIGFINNTIDFQGSQVGFLNITSQSEGAQVGFINRSKNMKGSQIGFINIVDSIVNGIPLGFFSFVKVGGYKAIEISSNEIYDATVSFKFGIPVLYTLVQGSYNTAGCQHYALGGGIGTLIKMKKNLYINPELQSGSSLKKDSKQTASLSATVRYNLSLHTQIAVGPSVSWTNDKDMENSFLGFANSVKNDKNHFIFGIKAALSLNTLIL